MSVLSRSYDVYLVRHRSAVAVHVYFDRRKIARLVHEQEHLQVISRSKVKISFKKHASGSALLRERRNIGAERDTDVEAVTAAITE